MHTSEVQYHVTVGLGDVSSVPQYMARASLSQDIPGDQASRLDILDDRRV